MIEKMMTLMQVGVEWVLYLLILLSVLMVGFAIERAWLMVRRRGNLSRLRKLAEGALRGDETALNALRSDGSAPAEILCSVMEHKGMAPEALQEMMDGLIIEQRSLLERRLDFFATVGSSAPFIGLFGTVLGIVKAFADLSVAESTGPQVVMAGISEALVATAVGLGVAIPSVVLFNVFKGRVRDTMRDAEVLLKIVMARWVDDAVSVMVRDKVANIEEVAHDR